MIEGALSRGGIPAQSGGSTGRRDALRAAGVAGGRRGERPGRSGGSQAADRARAPRPGSQRGRVGRAPDRRALGRSAARGPEVDPAGVRLAAPYALGPDAVEAQPPGYVLRADGRGRRPTVRRPAERGTRERLRPARHRRDPGRGARALARPRLRRPRGRALAVRRDRPARGAPPPGDRGEDRRRPRSRTTRRGGRRARGAHPRLPLRDALGAY